MTSEETKKIKVGSLFLTNYRSNSDLCIVTNVNTTSFSDKTIFKGLNITIDYWFTFSSKDASTLNYLELLVE
jgi:hypothetical protein